MTASYNADVALEVDSSVQAFLYNLGLPLVHPLNYTTEDHDDQVSFVPPRHEELSFVGEGVFELPRPPAVAAEYHHLPFIGPMSPMELHDHSVYELCLTLTKIGAPLIAMGELWLRLFAFYICPVCLVWLGYRDVRRIFSVHQKKAMITVTIARTVEEDTISNKHLCISILGLVSSAVLFTDSLYVYQFGRLFGFSLCCMASVFAFRVALSLQDGPSIDFVAKAKSKCSSSRSSSSSSRVRVPSKTVLFQSAILICQFATVVVFLQSGGRVGNVHSNTILHQMPHPGIDLPTIEPGLYYSKSNPLISSIASILKESTYTYDVKHGATLYLVTGDQRTGIPFLVNSVEDQQYIRAYVTNPSDGEHVALDIAFPFEAFNYGVGKRRLVHDTSKPVFLVLHGLNGGSHELYVKDLVKRRRAEGSTVIVLIARGMMDTKMTNWNVFHGARTGDVDIAARALKRGLASLAEAQRRPRRQILVGVGYSMGAIILSNYVSRSGKHCSLDAAIAVSGGLDMRQNLNFRRSMRLWQPMLTFALRDDILIGTYSL